MTAAALFIFVAIALSSCGSKKKSGLDTLIYGTAGNPVNLDPAVETDSSSSAVVANVCEGLVGYEGETETKIVPKLAAKWDISSDGKTYTFSLRQGVKFHDGTDVDADAVLFSLLRQQDQKHPYYSVSYVYWRSMGVQANVESIQKEGEDKIVVKLKNPDSAFLAKMALHMGDIISPTAYKALKERFDQNPVCAGPFAFKQWSKNVLVLLERNDNYWNKEDLPKVKRVIFKLIGDAQSRLLALEKGEIDVAEAIGAQNVPKLKGNLVFIRKSVVSVDYLNFVTDQKPFNDVRVRLAVAHLLDKKKIAEIAAMGYGIPLVNPFPPSVWAYNYQIEDYQVDVEKAKELLKEAGYPQGFTVNLFFNKENDNRKRAAELIQNQLSQAGVKVNIRQVEWGTLLDIVKWGKEPGMHLFGWVADYLDPDDFLTPNFSAKAATKPALNTTFWANKEFDRLNEEALRTSDQAKRTELYYKSQEIFHTELPSIPLTSRDGLFGARKNVKGFEYYPLGYPVFKNVSKE